MVHDLPLLPTLGAACQLLARQQAQPTHLEAAGLVGSARRVSGMQPGTGQAAGPWWPILSLEVEEDAGMGLCWSHGHFH